MKKLFLFAAGALCLAVACKPNQDIAGIGDGRAVDIMVSINNGPETGTRALGTTYADESKVNSLQVFVFNGDDREAYRDAGAAMQALIPATAGERTVWAVVNAPNLSDVMKLSDLRAAVSNLSDNIRTDDQGAKFIDSFVMTGSKTQELVDGGNVPISVKRIVARASIAKISSDFKDYRENYQVNVKGIYLINVAGGSRYDVGGEPESWVNKLGHSDASHDALLYDAISDVIVKNGSPYVNEHAFYPYPNIHPTSTETPTYEDEWNPRGTMLVIEAEMLDGEGNAIKLNEVTGQTVGYYPISLPAIERNKTYIIDEVCITRLPGEVPYRPIETGESQVTITVDEWELGLNLGNVRI